MPNILSIPAFLVVALMKACSSDAAILCIKAIEAIKERATQSGEDPMQSQKARHTAYVAVWLWNVVRDRSERTHGVRIGPVATLRRTSGCATVTSSTSRRGSRVQR